MTVDSDTGNSRKISTILIAVMTAVAALQAWASFRTETEDTAELLGTSARAIEFTVDSEFRAIDDLLADTIERSNAGEAVIAGRWPDPALSPWLRGRLAARPEIQSILLIAADGHSIGVGLRADGAAGIPLDVSGREYFQYHLAHPDDRGAHVGDPFLSRIDGRPSIPMSRAIVDGQGRLVAILRVTVDPAFLAKGLAALLGDSSGFNALVSDHGIIIARAPDHAANFGKSVAAGELFHDTLPNSRSGIGRFISPLNGKSRILAYRRSAHYPVVIVAGVSHKAAYADWRSEMVRLVAILILLSGTLHLFAYRSDRREALRAHLAATKRQAEITADRALQRLADAIESVIDAIAVYDADDCLVICNGQYRTVFDGAADIIRPGVSFAAVIQALGDSQAINTGDLPFANWAAMRLEQHRQATGMPAIIRMANGRWYLSREFRTHDGGVVGVRTDITQLKQREQELDALRRRYELILDSAGEGIVGLDPDGNITFANRAARAILHTPPDAMAIGQCFLGVVMEAACGPDGCTIPDSPITAAYRNGATQQIDNAFFRRGDGRHIPVEYFVAPILAEGAVIGAVLVFRDTTLRRQYERILTDHQQELEQQVAERTGELQREVGVRTRTEQALRASRERMKRITDSLFEGVLVVDRGGHLAFANPSARRLLGCDGSDGDIEGHPLDSLFRLKGATHDLDFADAPWQRVVAEGITLKDDNGQFITAAGKMLSVAYACSPLTESETSRSAIISFRDTEALKRAQREALQASRLASVGQLAAGIAHEINTPVQYVGDNLHFIGDALAKLAPLLDMAHNGDKTAFDQAAAAIQLPFLRTELPTAVEESLDGVAQIARIVLSMKEFSHPGTSAKTMTDINRAIESTLVVCHNTWKLVAVLAKDLDPALPPVLCYAGEMNQVFLNLIVNAVHAIEASGKPLPGTLSVGTRAMGDQVEIRIGDSGTGIDEAISDRIFDPFFTTKDVGKGTGQGLAICRDVVVTKHGGTLEVEGRRGIGAIFTIRIPIEGHAPPEDAA